MTLETRMLSSVLPPVLLLAGLSYFVLTDRYIQKIHKRTMVYDTCDSEIMELQRPYQEKLWAFNQLGPSDGDKKAAYLKEVFAECGDDCYIEL